MTITNENLSILKEFLKRAWKNDEAVESLINKIKDKPQLLKKVFDENFKVSWMFSIEYPKNATNEEVQQLIFKAIEERRTKQSLVS